MSKDNILQKTIYDFKNATYAFANTKNFWLYIGIAFSLYLVGIIGIIRADVYYIDDWGRSIIGYREWDNFSRYISYYLSALMHMSTTLSDIAPLTQFVAIFFLSLASVITVWSIREVIWKNEEALWESSEIPHKKRLTVLGIIASLPIGLSPYFLEELSFRFDSPYMALSVLFSVIPFIYVHHIRAYIIVTIVCILGMCMTYQASSSIYMIISILFSFIMLNQSNAGIKKSLIFLVVSGVCYLFSLVIFKLFIVHKFEHPQAGTQMLSFDELFIGIFDNMQRFLSFIWEDYGWGSIKILFLIILVLFVISSIYQSKINKLASLLLSIIVLSITISFSYGTYLVLELPLIRPRGCIGIGVVAGIFAIYIVSSWRGWAYKEYDKQRTNSNVMIYRGFGDRIFFIGSSIVICLFSWALIVFANAYGNALSSQEKFQNFRYTLLLGDLVNVIPKYATYDNYLFRIKGWVTSSPAVENASKDNPIMKRLVTITDEKYWVRNSLKHYGFGEIPEEQVIKAEDNEDVKKIKNDPRCNPDANPQETGKLIKKINNIYHKIEVYPHCTIITFKGVEKYTHQELDEERKETEIREDEMYNEQQSNSTN